VIYLAALRALLRRIPPMWWVVVFVCAFIAAGSWGLYHSGQVAERRIAERKARTDSIDKAVIVKRDAQHETDRIRALAGVATRASDSGRVRRQVLRQQIEPLIPFIPLPVVELIHADDKQIERDSVTITAHVAVGPKIDDERKAGNALDTLYTHQTEAPPKKGHAMRWLVAGAVVGAVLAHLVIR
jgi:hypothetical protein